MKLRGFIFFFAKSLYDHCLKFYTNNFRSRKSLSFSVGFNGSPVVRD